MQVIHKIKLNNNEIKDAIADYIAKHGVDTEGKTLDIEVTAGRKGMGAYASVNVESSSGDSPVQEELSMEDTATNDEEADEAILEDVVQDTEPKEPDDTSSLFG